MGTSESKEAKNTFHGNGSFSSSYGSSGSSSFVSASAKGASSSMSCEMMNARRRRNRTASDNTSSSSSSSSSSDSGNGHSHSSGNKGGMDYVRQVLQSSTGSGGNASSALLPWLIPKTMCDAAPPPPPPLPPPGSTPPPPPPPTTPSDAPKPTTTSEPPSPPPAEPPTTTTSDSITQAALFASPYTNPGPFEQAAAESKRLLTLDTFDGFRCDIHKQLSPYMMAFHSFWLGTSMLPDGKNKTYTFVTQVADETGFVMARWDPERGTVDGRVHRAVLGGVGMLKLQFNASAAGQLSGAADSGDAAAQQQQQPTNDQLLAEIDLNGLSWTANVKYGAMAGGNVFGLNYFQCITPRWALGGEGMYLSANRALLSNYTARYNSIVDASAPSETAKAIDNNNVVDNTEKASTKAPVDYSVCASYNTSQHLLSLNYRRVVTPPRRVLLAAELQCSPATLDSQVLVGGEFALNKSKVALCVDGGGRVQTTVEAKLGMAPGSPALNFVAEVDHGKDVMRFGYGLTIGGQ